MKKGQIPSFGPLHGVKVLSSGTSLAAPSAANYMAEMGASVIKIESTLGPDLLRGDKYSFAGDTRNQRDMALNLSIPEGRDVFLKLCSESDVLIESSKAGSYDKMNLSDETLWGINPKLVIVHVSGYGQEGHPDFVKKVGLDGIAQAYGGYMNWNGEKDKPMRIKPYGADYITGLFAVWAALAALYRATVSGEGESIDVAQYEAMLRIQANLNMLYWNEGVMLPRTGDREPTVSGSGVFRCTDGVDLVCIVVGVPVWLRAIQVLGLQDDPDFQFAEGKYPMFLNGTPVAVKFENALRNYVESRTSEEVLKVFGENNLPVSVIYNPQMMLEDPHYQAREDIISYFDDGCGKDIKIHNIFPKFKKHKTQVWRGSPLYGMDTNDILDELGYTEEQIKVLRESKTVK